MPTTVLSNPCSCARLPLRLSSAALAGLLLALVGCAASTPQAARPTTPAQEAAQIAHVHDGVHIVAEAPDTCPVCNIYSIRRESVVRIRTESGQGTGVVIDDDGTILTNAHVVGDSPIVAVETFHGTLVRGSVARKNKDVDLALLKAESPDVKWIALKPTPAPAPIVGSKVFVIGHPAGLGWTLTEGIISGHRKRGEVQPTQLIQITAAVSPGNSGGPALDEQSRWIGTVSSKLVGPGLENISFVIPAEELLTFVNQK